MPNHHSIGRDPVVLSATERTILLTQVLEARSMHEVWMQRGRAFLAGRPIDFPAEFAMRDDMCPIGTWLRERIDPRLRATDLYERTCTLHTGFHSALGRLFKEDIHAVSSATRAEFQRTGVGVTECIDAWVKLARAGTAG